MNTATPVTKKKKNLRLLILVASVAIVLIVAFVLMRSGFDKKMVKEKLDIYIAMLKERALAQGRDLEITYGELDLEGGFASRHVVIHDIKMIVKPSNPQPLKPGQVAKSDSLTVTTPEALLFPTSVDLSSFRLSLPKPVNFAGTDAPEKSLMKVESSTPFEVEVGQLTKNRVPYIRIDHTVPASYDLTYLREQQANGAEDATPQVVPVYDTLHVAIAGPSTFKAELATDGSRLGTVDLDVKQLTMTPKSAPDGVITVGALQEKWSNSIDVQQQTNMSVVVNVGPITGPANLLPYAPIAFQLDATYTSTPPKAAPDSVTPKTTDLPDVAVLAKMSLKKLALTLKDASIVAQGDFVTLADDELPNGKAEVVITNVPFFRSQFEKTGMLNPQNTPMIAGVIQQMTGTPLDQLKDTTIPITREHKGTFHIGNASLEELLANVIRGMMGQKPLPVPPKAPMPGSPALPAPDKAKLPPVAVPDNGVRG